MNSDNNNTDASFAVIAEFVSARTGDSGWTGTCPGGCRGGGNIRFRCFRCFRFGFATVSAQFVDAYFQLAAEVVLLDALVYICSLKVLPSYYNVGVMLA